MRRAGVIINPTAGRGNGKGLALAERLKGRAHVHVRVLDDFTRMSSYLLEMAHDGVTDLFISSGDGTVQAVQTLIAERKAFAKFPRICLLPHGTTNLTAIDVGFQRRTISAQADFICKISSGEIQSRKSLRVLNAREGGIRHGMTLGAGASATATRHAQTAFNDRGVKGSFASFATIAGSVVKAAFTTATPHDIDRLDRPCPMRVVVDGKPLVDGPQLMFVATTLDKLFFKARPFWGGKNGAIRGSVFPHPMPNVLRWVLPLMYGAETRKVPDGAHSFSSDAFEIACAQPFVMDGEFFEGPSQGGLRVEAGPIFEFIVK